MRSIKHRKFLMSNLNDVVSWNIEEYTGYDKGKTTKSVALDFSINDGRNGYSLNLYKDPAEGVAKVLSPLNTLIDALSKAGIEFAKACNTVEAKTKLEIKNPKKNESKAKTNPSKG